MRRYPKGSIPIPGLRWRGLNLQFFAVIFLPLTGILLLITFGSVALHQRAMRNMVGERDERAVKSAARALSEQINYRGSLVHIAALRVADGTPPHKVLSTFEFISEGLDYGLAFYTSEGELLASIGEISLWENPPQQLLTVLASDPEAEQLVFSPPVDLQAYQDILIFVAFISNGKIPIAIGAFSPLSVASLILSDAFSVRDNFSALLVAPNHQTIYQIGDFGEGEDTEDHPGVAEALQGESGATYIQVDGGEHVVAYSPISPVSWALVVEEPWKITANPWLNTTLLAPLVLVPVLLLALLALWFGAHQIIHPLQALETRASDLAWGNYDTIADPVGGVEEIERLQRTLIHLAEKIQRFQESHHSFIGAMTAGQEEERQRLARELHDDTIQSLIALNQRVQLAQLKIADDPDLRVALDEIQNLTDQTIQDVRRLVRALRPLYIEDLGLVAALKMLARESSASEGITIHFHQTGTEQRLSSETELALFRIAQEGINNIIRHSDVKQASLKLEFNTNSTTLVIQDSGKGFDVPESPAEFAPHGHFGLLGMHERAELIGARFEINASPGKGTRLVIQIDHHD